MFRSIFTCKMTPNSNIYFYCYLHSKLEVKWYGIVGTIKIMINDSSFYEQNYLPYVRRKDVSRITIESREKWGLESIPRYMNTSMRLTNIKPGYHLTCIHYGNNIFHFSAQQVCIHIRECKYDMLLCLFLCVFLCHYVSLHWIDTRIYRNIVMYISVELGAH